jgi:hypothetical protein
MENSFQDGAAVLEKWAKIRSNPRELSSKPVGIAWPAPPADNTADMSGKWKNVVTNISDKQTRDRQTF